MCFRQRFFVLLILIGARGANLKAADSELRCWEHSDGRVSTPAVFVRFSDDQKVAYFRSKDDKPFCCSFYALCPQDQTTLRNQSKRRAVLLVQSSSTDDTAFGSSSPPRTSPYDPRITTILRQTTREIFVPITRTEYVPVQRTETYTVQVPVTTCSYASSCAVPKCTQTVRCVQRCGLFGLRRKIVYKSIPSMASAAPVHASTTTRSETRTRSVTEMVAQQVTVNQIQTETVNIPSSIANTALIRKPGAENQTEEIDLKTPQSAGAIASRIAGILEKEFPRSRFVFSRKYNDTIVDYEQEQVGADGNRHQVFVEILSQPNLVQLTVAALNDADVSKSEAAAKALHATLKGQLTAK